MMADSTINYGFPFPDGGDKVLTHQDIEKLAKAVDARVASVDEAKKDREAKVLGASAIFDELPTDDYTIWSGAVSEALGLPTTAQVWLHVTRWGAAGGAALLITRSTTPRMWITSRLSGGWVDWVEVGAPGGEVKARLQPASLTSMKSAGLAFSLGYGGAVTSGAGTTSVIQYLHRSVTRMQLHLRNWNPRYVNADRAAATLTGVRIGRHTGNGNGTNWVSLPAGSTAYVSGWVDVPEALRGGEVVVQYTWSGSDVTRTLGTAWEGGRTNNPALWAWLELEVPAAVPVVSIFGSSTPVGVGSDRPVIDSALSQWAREHDAIPMFWAHSGDKASGWTATGNRKWELYGTTIAAPDVMLYSMGSNDWAEGISAEELQARIEANVTEIHQRITSTIFGTTITPRRTPPGNDQVRIDTNAWMASSGLFRGVFDFAGAVALPDGTLDPAVDADGTHVNSAGHARLAAAIDRPIVDQSGVTYLGDGVYEIS